MEVGAFFSTSLVTTVSGLPATAYPALERSITRCRRVAGNARRIRLLLIQCFPAYPKTQRFLSIQLGKARPRPRFFIRKSKNFAVVRIEDPFILKTDWNYKQL